MDWQKQGKYWIRKYKDYGSYVQHQQSKLAGGLPWLKDYDLAYRATLYGRLCETDIPIAGKSVLCLGARIGTEVKAFIDAECFAVGVDVNPGQNNQYVIPGDFHELVWPDRSIDIVFTNSFDHALDIAKMIQEIHRVLKDGGYLIFEDLCGGKPHSSGGPFESFSFETNDLISDLVEAGFEVRQRIPFEGSLPGQRPRKSEQIICKVKKNIIKDYELC